MRVCRIEARVYTLVCSPKQNMQQHDERYIPQTPTDDDEHCITSSLNRCVSGGEIPYK